MLSPNLAGSILLASTFCFSSFHGWPFGFPLFDVIWKKTYHIERFWPEKVDKPEVRVIPQKTSNLERLVRLSLAAATYWLLPGLLGLAGILNITEVFYPPFLTIRNPFDQYFQVFGVFVLLMSLLLLTWAFSFVVREVYGKPPDQRLLMKIGPYKYVRHPVYLSFVLFGIGTVFVSLNILMLVVPGYLVYLVRVFRKEEETDLAEVFGKEFDDYKHSTGGFFPKLR